MYINANQILTELNDNKPFKNPLVLKQELIEATLIKKEDFLQTQVKAIFEDKEYYSSFRESAISNKDLADIIFSRNSSKFFNRFSILLLYHDIDYSLNKNPSNFGGIS